VIVIADTGPINYLILIGAIEALPSLYHRVLIPPSVFEELGRAARAGSRADVDLPTASLAGICAPAKSPDADLAHLDAGEHDAILLAEELRADQLIIDEIRGRREAKRRRLPFTGTLGVLLVAAESGLLDLKNAVERLRETNFHIAQEILDRLIKDQP
jgi:predicted nucleic acid-binding protein